MSIINDIGEMALSTRLMRLSEIIRRDVTQIYKENGVAFESRWFPVLYVLSKRSPLSVIELAEELNYAHPSVIALVKEMEEKKLIRSHTGKSDKRKRFLSLTPKALKMSSTMEPLWKVMRSVAKEISGNGTHLMRAIENTEHLLNQKGFYERYNSKLKRP
jgi:DNA-binding MarR family transcriptional regulator